MRRSNPLWRISLRFVPSMAALLWPWPGLAQWFSGAFGDVGNALAGTDLGSDSLVHFTPQCCREHPWWVLLSVTNALTGEALSIPVDTRTIAYIRFAVFLALALSTPIWRTRRGLKALGLGFALLVSMIALSLALPLLQMLGMVHVLALGVSVQSFLSVGILTLVSYPSMAYAIPGLIWLMAMGFGSTSDTPVRPVKLRAG